MIDYLEHGASEGGIGVAGPMDGSAYFSNFAYEKRDDLEFVPPVPRDVAPGTVMEWELSGSLPVSALDLGAYPLGQDLGDIEWTEVVPAPSGLVDVARFMGRTTREPECVLARAVLTAGKDGPVELAFGYSDWVGIFLNEDLLFQGGSAYQSRDPSFLGIVGLFDSVFLPLKQGENELLLVVAESFGGWGFMCRDRTVVYLDPGLSKVWETGKEFRVPESAVYDPAMGVIYISNYDMYALAGAEPGQFISRVSLDGDVLESAWAKGLRNPTGMAVSGERLFVVERGGLAEIDTHTGDVIARHAAAGQGFLNDAAVDAAGNVYVSDSRSGAIYRLGQAGLEVWLASEGISQPNGLFAAGDLLLVGDNGDGCLKSVDLATKTIATLARMGPGTIDGIAADAAGNYIVSHWEGRVYRISPAGGRVKLLDVTGPQQNCADLAYVADAGLIVIPGFVGNRVTAYRLAD